MSVSYAVLVLAFVSLTRSLPSAVRRDDIVNGLRVVTTSVNASAVHHAYWFRRLFDTQLTPQEAACAQNATVFHAESGGCAWLYEQGPCAARQWLVLDRGGSGNGGGLKPVCRRRPCAPGYGFLADEARCAPLEDICPETGRVFRYSLRGEGRCHCGGIKTQGPDGQCHALFTQGPCQRGQVLVPGYGASLDSFRGACVRSPCPERQVRIDNEDGTVAVNCTELGTFDCNVNPVPLVSKESGAWVFLCDGVTRFALQVKSQPSSLNCAIKDEKGKCAETVSHSSQPFDWGFDDAGDDYGGGGGAGRR